MWANKRLRVGRKIFETFSFAVIKNLKPNENVIKSDKNPLPLKSSHLATVSDRSNDPLSIAFIKTFVRLPRDQINFFWLWSDVKLMRKVILSVSLAIIFIRVIQTNTQTKTSKVCVDVAVVPGYLIENSKFLLRNLLFRNHLLFPLFVGWLCIISERYSLGMGYLLPLLLLSLYTCMSCTSK